MQFNASGGSGYDETLTTSMFRAYHFESDSVTFYYEFYGKRQTASERGSIKF